MIAKSPLVGGFSSLIDAIQAAYGWNDEEVFSLSLPRVNQIRDAIYIRTQAEMYARHLEVEWETKHIATMVVSTAQAEAKWKKSMIKTIAEWDMDKISGGASTNSDNIPDEVSHTSNEELREKAIEEMWNKGAEDAMQNNMSKASFTQARLG